MTPSQRYFAAACEAEWRRIEESKELLRDAYLREWERIDGPFERTQRLSVHSLEWKRLRSAVFARDDFTCTYCGTRGGRLECDHIEPVALGGCDEMHNLTTACHPCNRSKGSKRLEDWRLS